MLLMPCVFRITASLARFGKSATTESVSVSTVTWPPVKVGNASPATTPFTRPCKSVCPAWTVKPLTASPLMATASILIFSSCLRVALRRSVLASRTVSLLPLTKLKLSTPAKPTTSSSVRCSLIGGFLLPGKAS